MSVHVDTNPVTHLALRRPRYEPVDLTIGFTGVAPLADAVTKIYAASELALRVLGKVAANGDDQTMAAVHDIFSSLASLLL